jgi:hypothetical protein
MLRRRPLSVTFSVLVILLIPVSFVHSLYWLVVPALLIAFYGKIPVTTTKCPGCRKDNVIELRTRLYHCFSCNTLLRREPDGWSHIQPQRKQKGSP